MQKETMDVYRESGEGYGWIGGGSTHSKNLFPPPSLEEYHDRRMFAVSRALTYIRIVRKNSKSQKDIPLRVLHQRNVRYVYFFPPSSCCSRYFGTVYSQRVHVSLSIILLFGPAMQFHRSIVRFCFSMATDERLHQRISTEGNKWNLMLCPQRVPGLIYFFFLWGI